MDKNFLNKKDRSDSLGNESDLSFSGGVRVPFKKKQEWKDLGKNEFNREMEISDLKYRIQLLESIKNDITENKNNFEEAFNRWRFLNNIYLDFKEITKPKSAELLSFEEKNDIEMPALGEILDVPKSATELQAKIILEIAELEDEIEKLKKPNPVLN